MKTEGVEVVLNGTCHLVDRGTRISRLLTPSHGVSMICGGKGVCRKCRVRAWGELSPLTDREKECFTKEEQQAGYRLACCTTVEGPCRILTDSPGHSRICAEGVMPDFRWDPCFTDYGAAIDVGTTTLALHLYDRCSLRAEVAAPNPQSVFGGDVISRITQSLEGKGAELSTCIRQALSSLLTEGAVKAGIPVTAIDSMVITGNTTMLYLLTGRDVRCLSQAPFEADHLFGETLTAEELELPCRASVYLTPCISAFVGGDITTALLASGIYQSEHTAMLADIGTNGEIALFHNGELLCCATAAGPAFEGAGLSMGMTGMTGAIDRLTVEGRRLRCHVIDEAAPIGICGSGIVDAIACLLKLEQLDETGRLMEDPVVLDGEVRLTGQDVRMIQLAKGAIRAGMETLLHYARISAEDLQELAIAGGFGRYIDVGNAAAIGLIPTVSADRVRVLGNAALVGADMILLDKRAALQASAIAAQTRTVELSGDPVFRDQYVENMGFWNDENG
ncbi:MAG: DUF4445 domain-containing protein [Clostridia bacterium]|nr:DUF4445 domain-containing protein [Clostridia bacterium]